jgi:hypothetical protein
VAAGVFGSGGGAVAPAAVTAVTPTAASGIVPAVAGAAVASGATGPR